MFQIRSQVGVLRKAVIDEQAKNSLLQVALNAGFEIMDFIFYINFRRTSREKSNQ
jgi:hypothetical protein